MIEVQWFFVRWVPDLLRKEPRNVGILIRCADDTIISRFLGESRATVNQAEAPPVVVEKLHRWLYGQGEYAKLVKDIREQLRKYGGKAMDWIPKKYRSDRYHIILGGARFTESINVDEMWKEMVE